MKKILENIIYGIDLSNNYLGKAVSWLTTGLVLLMCVDVFRRYFLGATTVAIIEMEWHLFALTFLWSAGYTLQHDKHVRVDVFYNQYSEVQKAWVNLIGSILFLLPFCLVVIYTSYEFSLRSYLIHENSPNPGGLPARYFIKASILVGFVFLFLQSISLSLASGMVILGWRKRIFVSLEEKGGEYNG
ncbi:MAG: TRAP transporter small permease subunit [Microscillaceae bacterium]|nr:TRAP transporter small permease subunit [Microscillaceae bacterium]